MQPIKTLSLAPDVKDWLANSRRSRILHVFESACNLINERGEVLSIVTPRIGKGPFNLVVQNDAFFSAHLTLESPISIFRTQIHLGDLDIDTTNAKLWSPHPDWERLYAKQDEILKNLTRLPLTNYQVHGLDTSLMKNAKGPSTANSLKPLISSFSSAVADADISSALALTTKFAGLGMGLTPAGDDLILGALYAAWIIHPLEIARVLAEEIANTATPLTTSLSAAWLRSAGKGKAGLSWHEFFDALISANPVRIQGAIGKILAVGGTSGADALAGFVGTMKCWAELAVRKIH